VREIVEGRNAVLEALRAGRRIERVLIAEGVRPDPGLDEVRTRSAEAGVPVVVVARRILDAGSERGAHQGVIAEVAPFEYASLDGVLASTSGASLSLIVALDHVTDPGNLGAVIRSAECAGADAVIVTERRAAPMNAAAYKAAAGAQEYLPIVRVSNLASALRTCKGAGYWVAGASEIAEIAVWDAPLEGRIVLVMGSEGSGLARLTSETCDFLVGLPLAGRVSSLNVAQATTALAFEWVRRGRTRG